MHYASRPKRRFVNVAQKRERAIARATASQMVVSIPVVKIIKKFDLVAIATIIVGGRDVNTSRVGLKAFCLTNLLASIIGGPRFQIDTRRASRA